MTTSTWTSTLPLSLPTAAVRSASARLGASLLRAYGISVERRRLGELPEYRLRDLGITRAEALAEADRPFWKR